MQCRKLNRDDQEWANNFWKGKCSFLGRGPHRCNSKALYYVCVEIDYLDELEDYFVCRKHLLSFRSRLLKFFRQWKREAFDEIEKQVVSAVNRIEMAYHGYKY